MVNEVMGDNVSWSTCKNTETLLQELPIELLIRIFDYCDIRALRRLQQTCRRFYKIIQNEISLGTQFLITNQLRSEMRKRSLELLSVKEKWRISENWRNGAYKDYIICRKFKKCMPWLVLTRDLLWISRGTNIIACKRIKNSICASVVCESLSPPFQSDVCKFATKRDFAISGHTNGNVLMWKPKTKEVYHENCHKSDVHSVDLQGNIFATGSKDKTVKMWQLETEPSYSYKPLYEHTIRDRVWSVALSENCQYLAFGSGGCYSEPPLQIVDVNCQSLVHKLGIDYPEGSGILHIKWESPHILLASGYDRNVRKWDIRTGSVQQSWEDPFDSTIYCFATDNAYSLVTGASNCGRTVLWDMRKNLYVQLYFMKNYNDMTSNSPIYGLSFDACYLFAATDRHVHGLDFSVKHAKAKDYSKMYFLKH